MGVIMLMVGLTTLAANLMMEYGTLTKRYSMTVHFLVRFLSIAVLLTGIALANHAGRRITYEEANLIGFFFYIPCLLLFKETTAQKTFLFFMDFSVTKFIQSLLSMFVDVQQWTEQRSLLQSILYAVILAAIIPLYFKYIRSRVKKLLFLFKQVNPLYAAFPILSFILFLILSVEVNYTVTFELFAVTVLYISLVMLMYYLMFSHFNVVYSRLQTDSLLAQAEQQLSLQKKYYEEVERNIAAQQKIAHDTRHHLVALSSMAQHNDTQGIQDYIASIVKKYSPSDDVQVYCENTVVNAVIGGYISIAQKAGILVLAEIDVPQDISIDAYDLCALFGNTIENAVEACLRIPPTSPLAKERSIKIRARSETNRLIVRIENTFIDDNPNLPVGTYSSKGSGIGLESVKKIADAHAGSISCEKHGSTFVFSAVLCVS